MYDIHIHIHIHPQKTNPCLAGQAHDGRMTTLLDLLSVIGALTKLLAMCEYVHQWTKHIVQEYCQKHWYKDTLDGNETEDENDNGTNTETETIPVVGMRHLLEITAVLYCIAHHLSLINSPKGERMARNKHTTATFSDPGYTLLLLGMVQHVCL